MTTYKPKIGDILYRYEPGLIHISLLDDPINYAYEEFKVIKLTPCGCWVTNNLPYETGVRKYVSNGTTKRFAHVEKRDALYFYIRRKRKHIAILNAKMEQLTRSLNEAEELYAKGAGKETDGQREASIG